jgi:hypothetical protein
MANVQPPLFHAEQFSKDTAISHSKEDGMQVRTDAPEMQVLLQRQNLAFGCLQLAQLDADKCSILLRTKALPSASYTVPIPAPGCHSQKASAPHLSLINTVNIHIKLSHGEGAYQRLCNGDEGIQIWSGLAIQLKNPVQSIQAVAVRRRAMVPARNKHPSTFLWHKAQLSHGTVRCLSTCARLMSQSLTQAVHAEQRAWTRLRVLHASQIRNTILEPHHCDWVKQSSPPPPPRPGTDTDTLMMLCLGAIVDIIHQRAEDT